MLLAENIKLAFQSLRCNKMQAFLTMLGIIIGIGSVIAIMTVSSSLSNSISDSFQKMGAGNISVGLQKKSEESISTKNGLNFGAGNRQSSMDEEDYITDEMLEKLEKTFPEKIDAISITETIGSATASRNQNTASLDLSGINEDFFKSTEISLLAGRKIKQSDLTESKNVIMVSDKTVENLFDGDTQNALAQKIDLNLDGKYTAFYIVGVYEYEATNVSSDSEEDITTSAYLPLSTAKKLIHADDGYSQFTIVSSSEVTSVSTFASEVENFFSSYYRSNEDYQISTTTMESMTESMTEMINTVSIAISFIAGISLLVGGIGVMNIMLVSITERTREIGTRKALGAKNSSIRLQFIVESVILCLIGGILGIITGFVLGTIAAAFLGYQAAVPVTSIIIAVTFSIIIGVFFGYYPANKAAHLNPIDALRYES